MTCVECCLPIKEHRYLDAIEKKMALRKVCFACNFWLDKLARVDDPSVVRVDGTHYSICADNTLFRGFDGQRFNIHFFDGRRVITHNLWCQGDIPFHFRARLPDNARFAQ